MLHPNQSNKYFQSNSMKINLKIFSRNFLPPTCMTLLVHTTLAWSFKLKVHRNVVGDSACFLPAFMSEGEREKKREWEREKNHTFAELNGKRATTAITIFTVMMSDRSRWSANIKLIHLIFSSLSPPSPFYLAHTFGTSTQWETLINSSRLRMCCKGINESFVFTYKNYTRANTHMRK